MSFITKSMFISGSQSNVRFKSISIVLLVLALVRIAAAQVGPYGIGGGGSMPLSYKQQVYRDYPRYVVGDSTDYEFFQMTYHGDEFSASYGGTTAFRVKSDPSKGLDAHFIKRMWWTYLPNGTDPRTKALCIARTGIMVIQYDKGLSDTTTMFYDNDRRVQYGSWIPRCGFEQMYQWPRMEGENAWMSIGSSDRTASQPNAYATSTFLNMEGTDSTDIIIYAYKGTPNFADTSWALMPSNQGNIYITLEGYRCKKENLLGLQTKIIYTYDVTEGIDITFLGQTPLGKRGFVSFGSIGYGSAWDMSATAPRNPNPPYNMRWMINPDQSNHSRNLEEDCLMWRTPARPLYTTLSAGISSQATSFTVNEPPGGLGPSAYIDSNNAYQVNGGFWSAIIRNDNNPNTTDDWLAYRCTVVDNGATWTFTVSDYSTIYNRGANGIRYQSEPSFQIGDSVIIWGNYSFRGSGGEDAGLIAPAGGWYNLNGRTFFEFEGIPHTAGNASGSNEGGISYGLDSIRNAVPNLGTSMYRGFGVDSRTISMPFDETHQLLFAMSKVRIGDRNSTTTDSIWQLAQEIEGGLVIQIEHDWINESFPNPNPPDFIFTASAGDGYINGRQLNTASWSTTVGNPPNKIVDYTTAATGDVYPVWFVTNNSNDMSMFRWFYPFNTSSYVFQVTPTSVQVVDSAKLRLPFVRNDCREARATNYLVDPPAYGDSSLIQVVTSTQASMTVLASSDWSNVASDSLGAFRYSHLSRRVQRGNGTHFYYDIPISPSAIVSAGNTKLAMRFKKWDMDLRNTSPSTGSDNYWISSMLFSESTIAKPQLWVWTTIKNTDSTVFFVDNDLQDGRTRHQDVDCITGDAQAGWNAVINTATATQASDATATTLEIRPARDGVNDGACSADQVRCYRGRVAVPISTVENTQLVRGYILATFTTASASAISGSDSVYFFKKSTGFADPVTIAGGDYNCNSAVQLAAIDHDDIVLNTQMVIPIRSSALSSLIDANDYANIIIRCPEDKNATQFVTSTNAVSDYRIAANEHATYNPVGIALVYTTP